MIPESSKSSKSSKGTEGPAGAATRYVAVEIRDINIKVAGV